MGPSRTWAIPEIFTRFLSRSIYCITRFWRFQKGYIWTYQELDHWIARMYQSWTRYIGNLGGKQDRCKSETSFRIGSATIICFVAKEHCSLFWNKLQNRWEYRQGIIIYETSGESFLSLLAAMQRQTFAKQARRRTNCWRSSIIIKLVFYNIKF